MHSDFINFQIPKKDCLFSARTKMLRIYVNYLILFLCKIVMSAANEGENTGMHNQVILDVSEVVKEALNLKHEDQLNKISSVLSTLSINNSAHRLFYETEFSATLYSELVNVTVLLKEHYPSSMLFMSIKVPMKQFHENNGNMKFYTNLLVTLSNFSSFVTGLCFEMLDVEKNCMGNSTESLPPVTLLAEIQKLTMQTTPGSSQKRIQIGYAFNWKYHQCNVHNESKKHADFLIVNVPLQRNDNIFVESYGAFKSNINKIVENVMRDVNQAPDKNLQNKVYFRLSLTSRIATDQDGQLLLGVSRKKYAGEYGSLLSQYSQEWVRTTDPNRHLILDSRDVAFLHECDGINFNEAHNQTMLIPYLTNIPVINLTHNVQNQLRLMEAASLLLEDVAASGYNTIMIAGKTWHDMSLEPNKHFPPCPEGCRPGSVIYINNQDEPFSINKVEIERLAELGGMHLRTLVFYITFKESLRERSAELARDFEEAANIMSDANFSNNVKVETVCSEAGGRYVFGFVSPLELCDNKCAGEALGNVSVCVSLGNTSFTIIWFHTIRLESPSISNLVEKTMKRLDAFVIARAWLNIHSKPNTKVILSFRVMCTNGTEIPLSLYCSDPAKDVAQFYEMILTWARIFDFPIVVFSRTNLSAYSTPLTWQQLSISEQTGQMRDMMRSAPLFIRRDYLQSKFFNPWRKGMYPCLIQSKGEDENLKSLLDLNNNKFIGASIYMDLRSKGTHFIDHNELQTILLFAVGRFPTVDITIHQMVNLKILAQVASHQSFATNLEANKVEGKTIFLNLKISALQVIGAKQQINDLVRNLGKIGFQVRIHFSFDDHNVANILEKNDDLLVGCAIENCTSFAHQLVFVGRSYYKFSNMDYLVCENYPIPANNLYKRAMQDHLNSHLYLKKLLHHFYPNLKEIHFHLQPELVGESPQEENINLLNFLVDVTNFAKGHKVHFFPVPVLAHESSAAQASFWTVETYTNLSDPSGYQERPAQSLNLTTLKPKIVSIIDIPTYILGLPPVTFFAILVSIVSLLLVSMVIFLLKAWMRHSYLSSKEVNNFLKGRKKTLEAAVSANKQNKVRSGNLFDALVYQNDCELAVSSLNLDKGNMLSSGKISTFYRASTQNGQRDVIVEICEERCSKGIFRMLLSEVKMMCYVGTHGNIVGFVGCYSKEIRQGVLWIVREYCNGGTLLEHLQKSEEQSHLKIKHHEMIRFAKEISCGMNYLSGQNVIHGDLRIKNVYLDQNKTCKIGNYGLDRNLFRYETMIKEAKRELLPWRWMACESLQNMDFSSKSDVWSFGVTVWEIYSLGELPFWDEPTGSLAFIDGLLNGRRLACPTNAPPEVYDVMLKCWALEPENRPEFPQLVQLFTGMLPKGRLTFVHEN